jgi:hypothetical protein
VTAPKGSGVEIKVRGVKQLDSGARELFENIDRATDQQATQVTADQVAMIVRGRVPKKSGRLARSVHTERRGRVSSVVMGEGLPYARWIEYGGGTRPYRKRGRYVYPTAKRTERAFRKHAETATSQEIKGMRWPTPR